MKVAFLLSLLLAGAFCAGLQNTLMKDLFTQWKLHHKKSYKAGFEDNLRFNIFSQNYLKIQEINANQNDVVLSLNQFADLTTEEFRTLYTGYNKKSTPRANVPVHETSNDIPASVDWRLEGAVTAVKNQGSCGSCWAFSASGALESLYFIARKKLIPFSEQQLVDCVEGSSEGCNGGEMIDAFDYVAKNGIEAGEDYPYKGRDQKCAFDESKANIVNNGYVNVTAKDPVALKSAIVLQPVSVAVQADQFVFQFYKTGVIKALCGDDLNHGVLAVGYDVFQGTEAFIVKNSWGGSWGNNGYVYISTDGTPNAGNGVCGILAEANYPYHRC
jgi:C1A family cysteine protease